MEPESNPEPMRSAAPTKTPGTIEVCMSCKMPGPWLQCQDIMQLTPPHLCPMKHLPPFPDNGAHGNDAVEHIARLIYRGTSDDPGCERKTAMEIANDVLRFVSGFGAPMPSRGEIAQIVEQGMHGIEWTAGKRPSIAELEEILNSDATPGITILPDGSITAGPPREAAYKCADIILATIRRPATPPPQVGTTSVETTTGEDTKGA